MLSPKEIALVKALNSVMSVDFSETPLKTAQLDLLQQTVIAERFDMAYLPEYHEFLRHSAAKFLAENDTWLKAHEVTNPMSRTQRVGYVGVGAFGFVAI